MKSGYIYLTFLSTLFLSIKIDAAILTDNIKNLVGSECSLQCNLWIDSFGPCIEKLGKVGITLDPINGNFDIVGDKLGIYLCICNKETKLLSTSCLSCISEKKCFIDPLTITNYDNICLGKENPISLLSDKLTSATCLTV